MAGISVIIPAFNEAPRIGATVEALLKLEEVGEVLVVDDGSTDGTAGAAARSGARVIRMEQNRGKSAAVLHGLRQVEAPVVALVDANLGATAGELKKLFPPVLQGGAAMAVARFPAGRRRGGFGMVKRLASWAIRICTGARLEEPLSGQRVLRRELLEQLRHIPCGFGLEVALTIDALRSGSALVEVETAMNHRERGRDLASFLHRGRQLRAVLRELWRRRDLFFKGAFLWSR